MSLPRYRRSLSDRKLAGIFGGLGDAFGIDSTYLRLAYVLLALMTGIAPAILAYAVGWLITSEAAESANPPAGAHEDSGKEDEASGV